MTVQVDFKSFKRGIQAMKKGEEFFRPKWWSVKIKRIRDPWICMWTPIWHEKRGPYISIGILFIAIYRGY